MQHHIWDNDLTVDRVCAEAEARSPSVKPNQGNIQVTTQKNIPGAVNTRFLEEIFGFSWEDASVGSFRVYRRDGISFPIVAREWKLVERPFTGFLQGVHTSVSDGRIREPKVVTR